MRPDINFLRERFDFFNKKIFSPQLPDVQLKISNGKRSLGSFRHPRVRPASDARAIALCSISLSNVYDRDQAELEDVIIHEMIHYCVWLNRVNETAHGPEFRRLMNTINTHYGRNIKITENLPEEVKATDTRKKIHYVVTATMPDGNIAFACVAKSAIRTINQVLIQKGLAPEWYVTLDPWFNNYPTIRTPKLFKITPQDHQAHIIPAHKAPTNKK